MTRFSAGVTRPARSTPRRLPSSIMDSMDDSHSSRFARRSPTFLDARQVAVGGLSSSTNLKRKRPFHQR
jgi:hypothetical protein